MAEREFDLIVVGGGTGRDVVLAAEARGMRVALIEQGPLGGTCHNRGCMPTKMMIHSSDIAEAAASGPRFDVRTSFDGVDFPAIGARVYGELDEERIEREQALHDSELVEFYQAEGRFTGPRMLAVAGDTITAPRVVIAAGTRPLLPPSPALDTVPYITSDEALRLTELPRRLVIIGGGNVASELAHYFGALGSAVTMLLKGDRLLGREDGEIARWFTRELSTNVRVLTQTAAESVAAIDGGIQLTLSDGEQIEVDQLLVATGRRPNTDLLGIERAGVALGPRGHIAVNERFETSAEGVYAFGDITGLMELKHVAVRQARNLIRGLFDDDWQPIDYASVPHAVFSSPQVAAVGVTEEQLRAGGVAYKVGRHEFRHTGMGMALRENGLAKVLASADDDILGVHIVGPYASMLIQEAVIAMNTTGKLDAIIESVHPHPALQQVVEEACRAAADAEPWSR